MLVRACVRACVRARVREAKSCYRHRIFSAHFKNPSFLAKSNHLGAKANAISSSWGIKKSQRRKEWNSQILTCEE